MKSALEGFPSPWLRVDDFAIRRRQSCNTILIDMGSHRPVDVSPGRESGTLAAWLREHPEIRVVCRDRAGTYVSRAAQSPPARGSPRQADPRIRTEGTGRSHGAALQPARRDRDADRVHKGSHRLRLH
jgi:Transposase